MEKKKETSRMRSRQKKTDKEAIEGLKHFACD